MNKPEDKASLSCGHRQRLRQKFLAGQLAEYEILELLLTYIIPRRDVRTLSRQLYKKYGGIHQLMAAPIESLVDNDGIKENSAVFFKLIYHLMQLEYKAFFDESPIFFNHEKLLNYCKLLMADKTIEEFHVFYLDVRYRLIKDELHSTGTIDWAAVYIREIAKKALDLNAHSVVLLHNHPSGYTSFSSQDIEMTQELEDTLKKLAINLYDHLLVSGNIVYSACNMHLLDKKQ